MSPGKKSKIAECMCLSEKSTARKGIIKNLISSYEHVLDQVKDHANNPMKIPILICFILALPIKWKCMKRKAHNNGIKRTPAQCQYPTVFICQVQQDVKKWKEPSFYNAL